MPKSEKQLRESIVDVLNSDDFAAIHDSRRATIAAEAIWDWLSAQKSEEPNKGKPWTDDALRVILQAAPTHENIARFARAFGRGPGAIEQIYRWAATTDKAVKSKRPDDAFIQQIKRVSKEVGWEAF
jgi:hypothetical protein